MNYGWRKDQPDPRDHELTLTGASLPALVDLRRAMPPVYDQGQLGSCTGNAIAGALEYEAIKQGEAPVAPSRLFIYYNERVMENSVASDAGASIRDGIKSVNKLGACSEKTWPYAPKKYATKPSAKAYSEALGFHSVAYARISHTTNLAFLNALKTALVGGTPFVFGFTCYPALESADVARTGILPMPGSGEAPIGGHAVLCVGYDDAKQMFLVRNSWGASWGLAGYFWMPYAYLVNSSLASDFWTISKTT